MIISNKYDKLGTDCNDKSQEKSDKIQVDLKKNSKGVPIMAQWLTNPTRNCEVVGSIPGLA